MAGPITVDLPRAGLFRRLAAILYDSLLLLAVLFIATFIALPLSGGEAVSGYNPFLTTYLMFVAFGFFAWFWTHGGQTLGMRAWRLRVVTYDGHPIGLWHALLRFLVAVPSWLLLGLGFLWSLWDKEHLTWHDHYSETILVVLPKKSD